MRVLLINPPRYNNLPIIREDRCESIDESCVHPPTSLIYIAGVLRECGFTVCFLDANGQNLTYWSVEAWINSFRPNWIIFRSTPSTFSWDCRIVDLAVEYKAKTLMLNWNLHLLSEKVKQESPHLDVYMNDYHYENLIPSIFLEESPTQLKTKDLPKPAWDLIPSFKPYYTRSSSLSPWVVVRGSKGCPFQCEFCIDADTGWFPRSPHLIGDELEYLVKTRKVPYISFFDNTFEIDKGWCIEIIKEIKKRRLKFKWFINSRADLICKHGLSFFKQLKSAGCDGSSIGIEFGSQEMLDASNKGTTVEEGLEAIKILRKAGIKSFVSCMIGYLNETREQMEQTKNFILKSKPNSFQINLTVPYRGTKLYSKCYSQGLIESLNWNELSCVPTEYERELVLSELTYKELNELRQKFYRKLYYDPKTLLSNFAWIIKHPSDLNLGVHYLSENVKRLKNKMLYSH